MPSQICIGDVHGKYNAYERIIKEHRDTIQVGDMGVGFRYKRGWDQEYGYRQNPHHDLMVAQNALYIRGNHDNPNHCRRDTQWIPDGTVKDDMMFIGGAYSIDKIWRTEGEDWWPDEELNEEQFKVIQAIYTTTKPNCMITHDCPFNVYPVLHSHHWLDEARTPKALQAMLDIHRPKIWVFGHHHKSFDQVIDGTRFVCLAELEVKEINWER